MVVSVAVIPGSAVWFSVLPCRMCPLSSERLCPEEATKMIILDGAPFAMEVCRRPSTVRALHHAFRFTKTACWLPIILRPLVPFVPIHANSHLLSPSR